MTDPVAAPADPAPIAEVKPAPANNETPLAADVPDADPALPLHEFCQRLSQTVRSPEEIAAFFHDETVSGRLSDTSAAYRGRFDALLKRPAK